MTNLDTEDKESSSLLFVAKCTMVCTLLVATIVAAIYAFAFWGRSIETQPDAWGQLGDYFGGVMNPIVGLATVVLIFVTVRIQTRELRSSLEELRQSNLVLEAQLKSTARQNFEQTLFAWLSNYRDLLDSVVVIGETTTFTGRRALHSMYLRFISPKRLLTSKIEAVAPIRRVMIEATRNRGHLTEQMIDSIEEAPRTALVAFAEESFGELYAEHEYQLDSLFRTLFRIFRWIDEHEELSVEQKWFYAALVRAQLSWTELAFLFYNGLSARGSPFATIANKYAIFDNLNLNSDIALWITKLSRIPDPYGIAAFNSAEAKRLLRGNCQEDRGRAETSSRCLQQL
ncbi:putative phage abortive infection protein [Cupriavidus pauculus]|nr:putative phage abortive infection protein [Cupriavidus pauculus]